MSYDTAKLEKCDFCVLTCLIFTDLVTYIVIVHDTKETRVHSRWTLTLTDTIVLNPDRSKDQGRGQGHVMGRVPSHACVIDTRSLQLNVTSSV